MPSIKSSRFDVCIKYLMRASNQTSNVGALGTKQMAITVTRRDVVFTLRYALVSYQKHHHHPKNSDKGMIMVGRLS